MATIVQTERIPRVDFQLWHRAEKPALENQQVLYLVTNGQHVCDNLVNLPESVPVISFVDVCYGVRMFLFVVAFIYAWMC